MSIEWHFDQTSHLYIHTINGQPTGYRIEPPDPDHHLHPVLGDVAGQFTLILPSGEGSVTYDSLEQAKGAAEALYQLEPTIKLPPTPPWAY